MSETTGSFGDELLWYLGLDDRTKSVLEAVYARDRAIALAAVTGREVAGDELGHDSLGAALGGGSARSILDLMPYIVLSQPVVIDPAEPTSASPVRVTWAETNQGAAAQSHVSAVRVIDGQMDEVAATEQWLGPLGQGGEVEITADIGTLRPGDYVLQIWHNQDGAAPGDEAAADREQGRQSLSSVGFTVTSVAEPAPVIDDTADQQREFDRERDDYLAGVEAEFADLGPEPEEVEGEGYVEGLPPLRPPS